VVEDDEVVRGLTERILSSLGYRVFAVPGAEEARKISVEHRGSIDLLLTDVELKGMNGLELARQVVGCRPETKVLAMSGHAKEAALRANPLDSNVSFLAKPFGPRSLAGKVREVLDTEEAGS
jgi:DNA-binding NtrC family response regulator